MCWKINDGISILVEMQNKSMSVRGWVRMMKDEPEVLEPFSIRSFFVVVFVCDDALFLMRPLCFMLSFLIRLPAYPNVRAEPQSDIGRNRGKKKWNLSALEQCGQRRMHIKWFHCKEVDPLMAGSCLCLCVLESISFQPVEVRRSY